MVDAIACEPQFLDHLAPVWLALPAESRGTFLVDRELLARAQFAGIDADPIDTELVRRSMPLQPPKFDGLKALVASVGDIKVARRLGYGPFAFLEHGAGQTYNSRSALLSSYAGGPDREDNEVFLVPNEYSADRWRASYPAARVKVVGCPKLETLPAREPGISPTIAISFHWPGASSIPFSGNALGAFLPALSMLPEKYATIGHAHPKKPFPAEMSRTYGRAGISFVQEFADVCRKADVYVCDNSSTIFEFAATGRPVILMNAPEWRRSQPGPGLRFWDAADVGQNIWKVDELVPAIERALENRPEDVAAREKALEFVYPVRTGAADRAAAIVAEWAS